MLMLFVFLLECGRWCFLTPAKIYRYSPHTMKSIRQRNMQSKHHTNTIIEQQSIELTPEEVNVMLDDKQTTVWRQPFSIVNHPYAQHWNWVAQSRRQPEREGNEETFDIVKALFNILNTVFLNNNAISEIIMTWFGKLSYFWNDCSISSLPTNSKFGR